MSLVQQILGSGEMPLEVFQENVLYFGEERNFCYKISIFVSTSKSFQNMASFSLRPLILAQSLPLPLKKNLLIAFSSLGSSK